MPTSKPKQEEVLTAVVIADSYNNNFAPLTPGLPHCLQTVAGRPLLDFTLQWLATNNFVEVILYLSASPAEVKTWLSSSKWSPDLSEDIRPLNVTVIVNEDSRSLGDACRDLDEKGIVRGEFLMCHGDLVTNIKLAGMIESHRARLGRDKNGVMTKVMMPGGEGDVTRAMGQDVVVATDKRSGKVIFHQRSDLESNSFPIDIFQHEEVGVFSELSDPSVFYCSPAVLALFSDNFDKQDMDTLVSEILESDLVDYTIYMEVMARGTAARASSPYMMTAVNALVLARWMYPHVPHPSKYKYGLGHVYIGRNVKVGKGTALEECVLVGDNCVLGKMCQVSNSSIGAGSSIGDNCVLDNCVIETGVSVGDGVTLSHVIVGRNCVIPSKVNVGERVILGCEVELGPGVELKNGARVVASLDDDWGEDGDEGSKGEGDLGPRAFLYQEDEDDDEDCEDDLVGLKSPLDPWGEMFVADEYEDDSSDDEDNDLDLDELGDQSDDDEEEDDSDPDEHDDVKNFRREVLDSVNRGLEQGLAADNLVLEINGSKHAWNTTLSEVNQCVLYSVLTANISLEGVTGKTILPAVLKNINKLSQLLTKYSKSKSGQQYYLEGVEGVVSKHDIYLDIMPKILQVLYDKDILSDDSIFAWNKKLISSSKSDPVMDSLISKLKPFIAWLEESDEEESESD